MRAAFVQPGRDTMALREKAVLLLVLCGLCGLLSFLPAAEAGLARLLSEEEETIGVRRTCQLIYVLRAWSAPWPITDRIVRIGAVSPTAHATV